MSDVRIVYDGSLPIQERDENNVVVREYTWGLDMGGGIGGLLDLKQGGQNYSYHYDGKGNVSALIDDNESIVAAYTYDPFGVLLASTGTVEQPFKFSTKRYDAQTGLSYYGYRFYSPDMGKWLNRDPLGEAGGINLYGFVLNNPANFFDLDGLFWAAYGQEYSKIMGETGWETGRPNPYAAIAGGLIAGWSYDDPIEFEIWRPWPVEFFLEPYLEERGYKTWNKSGQKTCH